VIFAMYVANAESTGVERARLGGTLQNDILKEYQAQKEFIFPPRPSLRLVADTIRFCTAEMPRFHPLSISGYHIREAGATAAEELAFTVANGFAYAELGLQAGLSNFIPYLGPIVAAIPIALVAMPLGSSLLIWAVLIYTIIQSVEGYVIGPLIQRQAVEIPPAWTLVAIVMLGALFGVLGIALAMPLVAIGRVAIIRFYVEDYLGDDLKQTFNGGRSRVDRP